MLDEVEDAFGEFQFVSSTVASISSFPVNCYQHSLNDDSEWGEYMGSPLHSEPQFKHAFALIDPFIDTSVSADNSSTNLSPKHPPSESGRWEKPKGALPLSIFGDEEKEEPSENSNPINFLFRSGGSVSSTSSAKNGFHSVSGSGNTDIGDLVLTLYRNEDQITAESVSKEGPVEADADSDCEDWIFTGALSENNGSAGGFVTEIKREKNMPNSPSCGEVTLSSRGIEVDNANVQNGMSECRHNGWNSRGTFIERNRLCDNTKKEHDILEAREVEETATDMLASSTEEENGTATVIHKENQDTEHGCWELTDALSGMRIGGGISGKKEMQNDLHGHDQIDFEDVTMPVSLGMDTANSSDASNCYHQSAQVPALSPFNGLADGFDLMKFGLDYESNSDKVDESCMEFKDAATGNQTNVLCCQPDVLSQRMTSTLKMQKLVNFYVKLRDESLSFAVHHLDNLRRAKVVAALAGKDEEVVLLNDEIKIANKQLLQADESICLEGQSPRSGRVRELLETLQEIHLRTFESAYHLSSQIASAEKELRSAVKLFKHACQVIQIFSMASVEQQAAYINAWSNVVSVCAEELQHGCLILKQSMESNVYTELLLRNEVQIYVLALGEIYKVVEIIRASFRLYKPWILLSTDDLAHALACFEKCTNLWSKYGVKHAIEGIKGKRYDEAIKILLESIRFISCLNEDSIWREKGAFCRLSLLSLDCMQGVKAVLWNEEYYFLVLANLWANKISCEPPELSCLLKW